MLHYSPIALSGLSLVPSVSLVFPASSGIDDATLSAYAVDDLDYPSLSRSFPPPRGIDAETRYRRALYELEAAEQEYQAHVASKRAHEAAAIRRRAAAEAARHEHEIALYAEIE